MGQHYVQPEANLKDRFYLLTEDTPERHSTQAGDASWLAPTTQSTPAILGRPPPTMEANDVVGTQIKTTRTTTAECANQDVAVACALTAERAKRQQPSTELNQSPDKQEEKRDEKRDEG